jgi:hypothetical protein
MSIHDDILVKLPNNTTGEIEPADIRDSFDLILAPQEIAVMKGNNPVMKMEIEAAGSAAQMQVIDLDAGHQTAIMEYDKTTKSFSFSLFDPNTGVAKATFQVKQDGKAYIGGVEIATVTALLTLQDLDRPTVVSAYTATPTKAELVTAAKLLSYYSNDAAFWSAGHDFYVRDNPQTKMLLVKYRGVAANVDEATAGNFFFEKITLAT